MAGAPGETRRRRSTLTSERDQKIIRDNKAVDGDGQGKNPDDDAVREPQNHAGDDELQKEFRADPARAMIFHDRAHQRIGFLGPSKFDCGDSRDDVEHADNIVDEHRRKRDDAV